MTAAASSEDLENAILTCGNEKECEYAKMRGGKERWSEGIAMEMRLLVVVVVKVDEAEHTFDEGKGPIAHRPPPNAHQVELRIE